MQNDQPRLACSSGRQLEQGAAGNKENFYVDTVNLGGDLLAREWLRYSCAAAVFSQEHRRTDSEFNEMEALALRNRWKMSAVGVFLTEAGGRSGGTTVSVRLAVALRNFDLPSDVEGPHPSRFKICWPTSLFLGVWLADRST